MQASSSSTTRSLFVGDLSYFCVEADLKELFSRFGCVINCEIKRGKFGDSLMHGFVELDSSAGAQEALRILNDTKFMGRRIRLNWAFGNVSKLPARNVASWTQVHIAFSTNRLNVFATEEFLDSLYSKFGEIADITVKKHLRTLDPPSQSGYAFVYYYDGNAAVTAVQEMKTVFVEGIRLESSLSYRSEQAIQAVVAATSSPLTSQIVSNNLQYPSAFNLPIPNIVPTSPFQPPIGSQPPVSSNYLSVSPEMMSSQASFQNHSSSTTATSLSTWPPTTSYHPRTSSSSSAATTNYSLPPPLPQSAATTTPAYPTSFYHPYSHTQSSHYASSSHNPRLDAHPQPAYAPLSVPATNFTSPARSSTAPYHYHSHNSSSSNNHHSLMHPHSQAQQPPVMIHDTHRSSFPYHHHHQNLHSANNNINSHYQHNDNHHYQFQSHSAATMNNDHSNNVANAQRSNNSYFEPTKLNRTQDRDSHDPPSNQSFR